MEKLDWMWVRKYAVGKKKKIRRLHDVYIYSFEKNQQWEKKKNSSEEMILQTALHNNIPARFWNNEAYKCCTSQLKWN